MNENNKLNEESKLDELDNGLNERHSDNSSIEKTFSNNFLTENSLSSQEDSNELNQLVFTIDAQVKKTYVNNSMNSSQTTNNKSADQEVYIIFSIQDIKYGIPINRVLEIGIVPRFTPIPRTPTWLLGVTNLRGDIFSVVDLPMFLGLGQANHNTSRMMLVRMQQEELSVIVIVDQVNGLLPIASDQIKTSSSPIQNKLASFLTGFYTDEEKYFALIDIEKLLNSGELRQFEHT